MSLHSYYLKEKNVNGRPCAQNENDRPDRMRKRGMSVSKNKRVNIGSNGNLRKARLMSIINIFASNQLQKSTKSNVRKSQFVI